VQLYGYIIVIYRRSGIEGEGRWGLRRREKGGEKGSVR